MGKYALLIGNNNYGDPKLAELKTPENDVNEFAEVLKNERLGGYDDVVPLIDEPYANVFSHIIDFLREGKKMIYCFCILPATECVMHGVNSTYVSMIPISTI